MSELALAVVTYTLAEGWRVQCDEPGCHASIRALDYETDREAIEATLRIAIASGWLIAHDRFIRPRLDLCPEHRTGRR